MAAIEEQMGDCSKEETLKEGKNLLGQPTFKKMENGRFKCKETGHETTPNDMESYAQSKRCRLGLINFALSKNKPPLNMFIQDPLSSSKLKCKLTGDTINKTEEHIWKHINGKRFLNKLEQKEAEKLTSNGKVVEQDEHMSPRADKVKKKKKKKKNKKQEQEVAEIVSEPRNVSDEDSDLEENEFWIPPVGERWDFDDGGDRWDSGSESNDETEEGALLCGVEDEDDGKESAELSTRTKRLSIEVGPSSFASRKKKSKTNSKC